MGKLDDTAISTTIHAMDQRMPKINWRSVLNVFSYTGVADRVQIQKATRMDREEIRQIIANMKSIGCYFSNDCKYWP